MTFQELKQKDFLFDSHGHLGYDSYLENTEKLILNAKQNSVLEIVDVAIDINSSLANIQRAKLYPELLPLVGIDPEILIPGSELYLAQQSPRAFIDEQIQQLELIILNNKDWDLRSRVETTLSTNGIEFRRGLSGGGNQLRQPYLRNLGGFPSPESLPETDHVHHFAWYVGNYPSLEKEKIDTLLNILNKI